MIQPRIGLLPLRPTFFYGWVVVGGGFTNLLLAYGSHWSAGLFFEQLRPVFAADRAVLSGVFTLYIFLYPLINLVTGRLIDRYDPRWIMGAGGVSLGLGFVLMSWVEAIWQIYAIYGTLIALGLGASFVPASSTVVKWFVRRRGLAVGLVTSGVGLGTILVPPIAGLLIQNLGWRGAYFWLGIVLGCLLVLAASVMVREPEIAGLRPDGDAAVPAAGATGPARPEDPAWTAGDAVRAPVFWLMTAAYTFHSAVIFLPLVHLVGFAQTEAGIATGAAAWAISIIGIGSLAGRLTTAAIADRLPDRYIVLGCFLLQVAGFLGLSQAGSVVTLYVAATVYGVSYGALTGMMPVLVGNYFGRRHAGAIGGIFFAVLGCAAGLGPLLGGSVADVFGSYRPAFTVAAGANLIAFAIFLAVRRPEQIRRPGSRAAIAEAG